MNSVFLVDGAFFCHMFKKSKKLVHPSDLINFIDAIRKEYDSEYRLLRIYYYDCEPSEARAKMPVSNTPVDFKASPQYRNQTQFLSDLKRADYVSVREGRLVFRGWGLKKNLKPPLPPTLKDGDYRPDFEQKGVDIKIGLDIAWISMGKIAQRIYLVTGDSDFIPAMKFARRSGVQLFLITLGHGVVDELKNHADVLIEKDIGQLMRS
jgi:uncharacterized LabA/DUF88 family protein